MIFSNIVTSLLQLIFKPKVWVPLFSMLIISLALTQAMNIVLEGPLIDSVLYPDQFLNENVINIILTQYPVEIFTSIVLAFAMTVLGIVALNSTQKISQGMGLVKSINESMSEFRKSAGLAIVFWGAFLFALFLLTIITVITGISDILGFLLFVLFAIVTFVVIIKTIFVFPAISKYELKDAFKESWKFTEKRFWKTTFYLILIVLVSTVIGLGISSVSALLAGNVLELVVLAIGETFSSLYFIVAITNYFYTKQ